MIAMARWLLGLECPNCDGMLFGSYGEPVPVSPAEFRHLHGGVYECTRCQVVVDRGAGSWKLPSGEPRRMPGILGRRFKQQRPAA